MKDEIKEKIREDVLDNINEEIGSLINKPKLNEEEKEKLEFYKKLKEDKKSPKERLRETYELIKDTLRKYLDMKEEYYSLDAIWIIGTYFHKYFDSFPYIFVNAMRGSGKTRTLRLICKLSRDGEVLASPTEAVLFRTGGTLGIDEFESVNKKEKSNIRELLNTAYKKGIKIKRMKKISSKIGERQVVEEFEPYRPIILSNIWGMEEVLGDRCITQILEKSDNPVKTRLIEDFETNENIENIKKILNQCSLCSVVSLEKVYIAWNNYIIDRYHTTLTTLHTLNTLTTQTTQDLIKLDQLFNKIHDSNIIGRNLELFLPMLFIAHIIGDEVTNEILDIANKITIQKKKEEEMESVDVMVLDFISRQESSLVYYSVKELTNNFRNFSDLAEEWLNTKWFGRALKRLNLIVDKRRKGYGIEVLIDVNKAKNKLKMFGRK